jgi:hypothetical protein
VQLISARVPAHVSIEKTLVTIGVSKHLSGKRLVNYLAFGPREPEDVRLISGLDGGGEGLPVMRQQFLDPVYRMRRDAR